MKAKQKGYATLPSKPHFHTKARSLPIQHSNLRNKFASGNPTGINIKTQVSIGSRTFLTKSCLLKSAGIPFYRNSPPILPNFPFSWVYKQNARG